MQWKATPLIVHDGQVRAPLFSDALPGFAIVSRSSDVRLRISLQPSEAAAAACAASEELEFQALAERSSMKVTLLSRLVAERHIRGGQLGAKDSDSAAVWLGRSVADSAGWRRSWEVSVRSRRLLQPCQLDVRLVVRRACHVDGEQEEVVHFKQLLLPLRQELFRELVVCDALTLKYCVRPVFELSGVSRRTVDEEELARLKHGVTRVRCFRVPFSTGPQEPAEAEWGEEEVCSAAAPDVEVVNPARLCAETGVRWRVPLGTDGCSLLSQSATARDSVVYAVPMIASDAVMAGAVRVAWLRLMVTAPPPLPAAATAQEPASGLSLLASSALTASAPACAGDAASLGIGAAQPQPLDDVRAAAAAVADVLRACQLPVGPPLEADGAATSVAQESELADAVCALCLGSEEADTRELFAGMDLWGATRAERFQQAVAFVNRYRVRTCSSPWCPPHMRRPPAEANALPGFMQLLVCDGVAVGVVGFYAAEHRGLLDHDLPVLGHELAVVPVLFIHRPLRGCGLGGTLAVGIFLRLLQLGVLPVSLASSRIHLHIPYKASNAALRRLLQRVLALMQPMEEEMKLRSGLDEVALALRGKLVTWMELPAWQGKLSKRADATLASLWRTMAGSARVPLPRPLKRTGAGVSDDPSSKRARLPASVAPAAGGELLRAGGVSLRASPLHYLPAFHPLLMMMMMPLRGLVEQPAVHTHALVRGPVNARAQASAHASQLRRSSQLQAPSLHPLAAATGSGAASEAFTAARLTQPTAPAAPAASAATPAAAPEPAHAKRSVLVVGARGVGKSSLIRLLVGRDDIPVSDAATRCTTSYASYPLPGTDLMLTDTVGLCASDTAAETAAVGFALASPPPPVALLVLVRMLGDKDTQADAESEVLFSRHLCLSRVPALLVLTHGEGEKRRGQWWAAHEHALQGLRAWRLLEAVSVCAAANETLARMQPDAAAECRMIRAESQLAVTDAIVRHALRGHIIPPSRVLRHADHSFAAIEVAASALQRAAQAGSHRSPGFPAARFLTVAETVQREARAQASAPGGRRPRLHLLTAAVESAWHGYIKEQRPCLELYSALLQLYLVVRAHLVAHHAP